MRIDRYKLKIALAENRMPRKALYENPAYNLPKGTINSVCQEHNISLATAEKLAKALNCPIAHLLKRE